jgi:hypothetical protein
VSTEMHGWSAVVDGNGTKTKWQLIHCKLTSFLLFLRERVVLWHRHRVWLCVFPLNIWISCSVMEFHMNVMPLKVTPTQMHELLSWQGDSW